MLTTFFKMKINEANQELTVLNVQTFIWTTLANTSEMPPDFKVVTSTKSASFALTLQRCTHPKLYMNTTDSCKLFQIISNLAGSKSIFLSIVEVVEKRAWRVCHIIC